MTDYKEKYAGNYPGGLRVTAILNEGAITVGARAYDQLGLLGKSYTFAGELYEGDIVAIANDADVTFAATGGLPVVEVPANTETLVIGQIVSTPKFVRQPATSGVADTLAKRLADKYYRVAVVEFWGVTKIKDAIVTADGANALVPGVGATLKYNIVRGTAAHDLAFYAAASGGVGVIPFHYVPAGSDADTYTALVGITGMMYAVTGK